MWKILTTFALTAFTALAYASTFPPNTHYDVCFTPQDNCTGLIVDAIRNAKKSILVQAYSFTSYPIAKALVKTYERGIKVEIILDKSQFDSEHFSSSHYLMKHHIPIWKDDTLNIAHNKVMIIDGKTVETGSFNFTNSAQKYNAENVLIIQNPALAEAYTKNWEYRRKESQKIQ